VVRLRQAGGWPGIFPCCCCCCITHPAGEKLLPAGKKALLSLPWKYVQATEVVDPEHSLAACNQCVPYRSMPCITAELKFFISRVTAAVEQAVLRFLALLMLLPRTGRPVPWFSRGRVHVCVCVCVCVCMKDGNNSSKKGPRQSRA